MMKLKRIIQMLSDGKSFNAICKDTHSSKTTVSNYKKLVEGTKLPYVELLEKSDSELEQLLSSQLSKPSEDARKAPLQEMMPEIIKRLSKRYANIQLVYEEFYLKQEGEHYGSPSSRTMCSPMWKPTATPITTPTFQVKSGRSTSLAMRST